MTLEDQVVTLTLPYPPSANTIYPSARNGRRFLSGKGKAYHADVLEAVLRQLGRPPMLSGRLSVEIQLYVPDARRRDIANAEKALGDSLTKAGVWADDEQIDELHIVRAGKCKNGYVVVTIREVGNNPHEA